MKRFCPDREFPPYAFLPGKSPHPEKEGGHMFGHEIQVEALTPSNLPTNPDFAYALDLFNYGYYWESHVWWEELWHLAGRKGPLADLLKALIKFAAAGVKIELEQSAPSMGHIDRGLELIKELIDQSFHVEGLNLNELYHSLLQCRKGECPLRDVKIFIKR